ncbi:MAG: hypothetical protein K1X88_06945 [Nannocystaceae bacterium]|nr:hypothetical protein [Nannocystaceae bacterium]
MHPDVHRRALLAAAHLALVASTLAGCDRATTAPARPTQTPAAAPTPSPDPEPDPEVRVTASPARHVPEGSCEPVLDRTFADDGDDKRPVVSPRAQECCADVLATGYSEEHFWHCCAMLDRGTAERAVVQACSPWGPAVPPAMHAGVGQVLA